MLWRSQIFQLSECLSLAGLRGRLDGLRGCRCAAAVVGGVAGPVSGGGALPGDGDADVDAEQSGEQGGGQLAGQAEQCGGAGQAGWQPVLAQTFGESGGADGLCGSPAGEQPGPLDDPRPWFEDDAEPNADMWPRKRAEQVVGLYHRAWAHAAATIPASGGNWACPLVASRSQRVTLHRILVHVVPETIGTPGTLTSSAS